MGMSLGSGMGGIVASRTVSEGLQNGAVRV